MPLCNTTQISNTRATVGNLILSFLQRMSGDLLFIFSFTHTVSYLIQSFPFQHCQLQLLCFKTRIKFTVTEYDNGTVFNNYYVVKPKPKQLLQWEITSELIKQSELEANTCGQRQVPENMCDCVGFHFTSAGLVEKVTRFSSQ